MEQKLEPSEALANIQCADMLLSSLDEKSKPSSSILRTIDNESDEGLQDKRVSVVTMSKVGLITETNAEEFISTTKIKSSSLLSKSCTTLTISGNGCHSKVGDRSENGYVQEDVKEGVEVTRQGEGEDSVELPADVLEILQDKASEDVDLPVTKDFLEVETLTGGEEFSRDAALKRKFVLEGDDRKSPSKLSKFHWSQDVFVRNIGITSSSSTGEAKLRHALCHSSAPLVVVHMTVLCECFHLGIQNSIITDARKAIRWAMLHYADLRLCFLLQLMRQV